MHEAGIVSELIELVAQRVPEGSRVREVRVAIGLLTGVSPDCMSFYFEALAPDRIGASARLTTRLVPLRGACTSCGEPFELTAQAWLCGVCGKPTLRFENGDELDLEAFVVDDDEPHHHRAEDPQEER
jgi:hydrogenase nickel incorporation protein HypA/HybF